MSQKGGGRLLQRGAYYKNRLPNGGLIREGGFNREGGLNRAFTVQHLHIHVHEHVSTGC